MRLPIGQWPHHMTPSSHPIGCQVSAGRGSNFWLRSSAVWTEVATWQSRYIFIIFRCNLTVVGLQNCEKFVIKLVSKLTPILIKWEWRILKQNAVKHLKSFKLRGKLYFLPKTQSSMGIVFTNWFKEKYKLPLWSHLWPILLILFVQWNVQFCVLWPSQWIDTSESLESTNTNPLSG